MHDQWPTLLQPSVHVSVGVAQQRLTGAAGVQAKCLRVLQYFPPPDDPTILESLNETLRRVITGAMTLSCWMHKAHDKVKLLPSWLTAPQPACGHRAACCVCLRGHISAAGDAAELAGTEVAKNVNKNNAQHAIVFEAVALALALEADEDLLISAVSMLGKFISVREPNIKYLGLEKPGPPGRGSCCGRRPGSVRLLPCVCACAEVESEGSGQPDTSTCECRCASCCNCCMKRHSALWAAKPLADKQG